MHDPTHYGLSEPIAIIGMGCRLPGDADTPARLWSLVCQGTDAITSIPAARLALWDADEAAQMPPQGGFLREVDQFDPVFFKIAPREATFIDPQQRLLLEVSWEALEDAGIAPSGLTGSDTGVFVGLFADDYRLLQAQSVGRPSPYFGIGTAGATASGRLAYFYDWHGPALTVDTASSASLVAFHQACRSLQTGECDLALAAGVNLILAPSLSLSFSQAGMLAPDGRSKAFDDSGNGYVRGEGCGVVVLKRLAQAQADGDRILAVVRGTAINQDGASKGLAAPNRQAQEAVMRKALARAGVPHHTIAYVEAHGSGTAVGDPVEGMALNAVYGAGRSSPLVVGSVKTNIGHLESAAGIAGVIKTVLALQHDYISPHLHFQSLRRELAGWNVILPTTGMPWPRQPGTPRRAAVSSFGFSGTNAHVILEEAPAATPQPTPVERPYQLLTLSAQDEAALQTLAERYADSLTETPDTLWPDTCFTAVTGRAHFEQRLAVVAASPASAQEKLAAFGAGQTVRGLAYRQASTAHRPKLAFLFTGGGAQYVDMGRSLYATSPTFRAALDQCDAILRPVLEHPLLDVLYSSATAPDYLNATYMQPALFSISYALTQLWASWGVTPDVVIGHSTGEYAAACAAGILSLEDALTLVAKRSQLMQTTAPGEMVTVWASEAQVAEAVRPYANCVAVAVVNGSQHTVIAGDHWGIRQVLNSLPGVEYTRLPVPIASHSPLMDPILDLFEQAASQATWSAPRSRFVSSTLGAVAGDEVVMTGYWRRHIRDTVRFADAIQAVQREGVGLFLEVGPKPTLLGLGRQALHGVGTWLPSLQPPQPEWEVMLNSLAALYTAGVPVDWDGYERDYAPARQRVVLPTYPFQRQRYWFEATPARRPAQPKTSLGQSAVPSVAPQRRGPANGTGRNGATPPTPPSLTQMAQASDAERRELIVAYLQTRLRQVLGLDATQPLPQDRLLYQLGLDSLMTVEMQLHLERDLHVSVPVERILVHGSIRSLTDTIQDKIVPLPHNGQPLEPTAHNGFHAETLSHNGHSTATPPKAAPLGQTDWADEPVADEPVDFYDAAKDIPQIHAVVQSQRGRQVQVEGKWVSDFASVNYLGVDLLPEVMAAIPPAVEKWGIHPSWSRTFATPAIYEELEQVIARLFESPTILAFPAVTLLHAGILPLLVGEHGVIFKDIAAHHSVYEACRLAKANGAECIDFRNNDVTHLEEKLASYPRARTKLIAIDGVYSMSGIYPPLPDYAELARRYNARIYIDDAHGTGLVGENPTPEMPYGFKGNGIVKHFGLDYVRDRIVYVGSLSKAFASLGAFVTCENEAERELFKTCWTYIFSGPAPIASVATALAALRLNATQGDGWRAHIYRLTHRLVTEARAMGFEVRNEGYFPIVGVVIGTTPNVVAASQIMWEHNIFVTPALFPIVPLNQGLLRFSITGGNTEAEVDQALEALRAVRHLATPARPLHLQGASH